MARRREEIEEKTRALYHGIHAAQGQDAYIWQRLTSLITTEYLKVPEDWFVGKTCLDAGCGSNANATYSMLRAGAEKVYAFDLDETIFEVAPKLLQEFDGKYELGVGNVLNMSYPDNRFDFTHCAGVLHSTDDLYLGLQDLARVTKVGGTLYVNLNGTGGLVRQITNLLRDKYSQDEDFKSLVDNLNEGYLAEIFGWLFSEMAAHGDEWGEKIPLTMVQELFDRDLVLTIKDRIATPLYKESSEEEIVDWLNGHGFSRIERLTRYPRYNNVRRFLSPLYERYDKDVARLLYGTGVIQLKAEKQAHQ